MGSTERAIRSSGELTGSGECTQTEINPAFFLCRRSGPDGAKSGHLGARPSYGDTDGTERQVVADEQPHPDRWEAPMLRPANQRSSITWVAEHETPPAALATTHASKTSKETGIGRHSGTYGVRI